MNKRTVPVFLQNTRGSDQIVIKLASMVDGALAADPRQPWRSVGVVSRGAIIVDGLTQTVYRGHGTQNQHAKIQAKTKREAIQLLLERLGYHEVSMDDTIPDLLANLGE